ncbi:type II toxin-antitoxin system Phd/YefM family antitoxin [Anatilimnocola floriformis]|uniref:type II toxin-antitoxin system Phd/YefM family antitoxin n=1 Tax=Anatilimnocola floriformis TaxID=2948575 RepID=UPI0020C55B71|nr:hypothetical protein [Anatilimnocola floriformis]
MTTTVSLDEAAANLKELIGGLARGDEIVITKDQQVIAKITSEAPRRGTRAAPGFGKDSIVYIAPDFDAPLEEFREYME